MDNLESINEKLNAAMRSLDAAAEEIHSENIESLRSYIGSIGRSIGAIIQIQGEIYKQRPDLGPVEPDPKPDLDLDESQKVVVAALNSAAIKEIDEILLSYATNNWRKVAMLVGLSMSDAGFVWPNIPDIFLSQRVRKLVEAGHLEAQGNLQLMRFSEVRLPSAQT
jgi:hypothetical protein